MAGGRRPWGICDGRGAGGGVRFAFLRYGGRGGIGKVQVAGLERGGVGAVEGDGAAKFVPGGGVHPGGDNAEIDADVEEDGADLAVAVLGCDLGVHLLLGGGGVEGVITGRPARWDGPPFSDPRPAWAGADRPVDPCRGLVLLHVEGKEGSALAEPCPEGGEAEQAANHVNGGQRGIGGVEDPGEGGKPGEKLGVVFLTQCPDEVPAVGEESLEEAENSGGGGGIEAGGHGPKGTGLDGRGWG